MDRLDAMRALVIAVDRGSLSAAAQALRRSLSSITRAVDALEARVGAQLLRRTTRSLKVTEAGERYLAVARRVLAELDEAEHAGSVSAEPHGELAITAPIAFGTLHVRPIIDDFLAAHGKVRVRALLIDRNVSLVEEGIDVAVRIGALPDSSLIASAVGRVRRVFVASPDYLARYGRPRMPRELAAHRCISASGVASEDAWRFTAKTGRSERVRVTPVLSVNAAEAAIRSAVAGVGITAVLSYQVAAQLESGALVRLLATYEAPPVPVSILYAAAGARSANVRAFVELATPRLRALLSAGEAGSGRAR